jgi:hypothetical protein
MTLFAIVVKQVVFVVSEHHLRSTTCHKVHDQIDDSDAIGPAIDQVTDKDDRPLRATPLDVAAKACEERAEGFDFAVNIADDVNTVVVVQRLHQLRCHRKGLDRSTRTRLQRHSAPIFARSSHNGRRLERFANSMGRTALGKIAERFFAG